MLKRTIGLLLALALLMAGTAGMAQEEGSDMRIGTVDTGAFTMDYCVFGQGQRTLVILPGLSVQRVMGSAEAIAAAYQPLSEEFTVYVFERRNELPDSCSVRDMASDTAEAIRSLGLGPVCLFGASQGGMMAMVMAIEYPELVERLILGSTSARVAEGQGQAVEDWIRLARSGDAEALYLAFGEALYPEDVFEQSRTLLTDAAKTVTDEDLRRFIILAEAIRGFDVQEDLARVACPTLVIGSMTDRVLGAEASTQIAERVKDCELYMYEGYGHAVYDLAPDYKERMLRFLTAQ